LILGKNGMPVHQDTSTENCGRSASFYRNGRFIDAPYWTAERHLDAFILLGLVSASTGVRHDEIRRRLDVLYGFQTDIERYVFLRDLEASNIWLFKGILNRDCEMKSLFFEMSQLMPFTDCNASKSCSG
jgi:hypothetical protein